MKKLRELNLSEEQKQQVIDIVNRTGSCQNIKFLPESFREVFKLGNEINYKEHIKIVGTAQKFVDDEISKTINFENSATTDDIDMAIKMAYDLNLKGIAVFRDGCLTERVKIARNFNIQIISNYLFLSIYIILSISGPNIYLFQSPFADIL